MSAMTEDEIGYLEDIVSRFDKANRNYYGVAEVTMDIDDRDTLNKAVELLKRYEQRMAEAEELRNNYFKLIRIELEQREVKDVCQYWDPDAATCRRCEIPEEKPDLLETTYKEVINSQELLFKALTNIYDIKSHIGFYQEDGK